MTPQEPAKSGGDVPRARREVDDRSAGVLGRKSFEQHRHARHGLAGVLVHDERVPCGEQRAGERGDHHRVVDVRDHAEGDLRPDDEGAHRDRLAAFDRDGELLPPGFEPGRNHDVDHAACVGGHLMRRPVDEDLDPGMGDGHRSEAAPPPHAGVRRPRRTRCRRHDHDAAEHTYPVRAPVARERGDDRRQAAAAGAALAPGVESTLQSGEPEHLRGPGGIGRAGGHPFSLSRRMPRPWAPRRSRGACARPVR